MQEKGTKNYYSEKDCMSLEGFCAYIRLGMEKQLGSRYQVFVEKVYKNNICLQGLHIIEEGSRVSPIIYLDAFYDRYRKEPELLAKMEQDILCFYNIHKPCGQMKVDTSSFENWEQAKSRICFKLINKEQNREMLARMPHFELLDLAIVFYCLVGRNSEGQASVLVENGLMEYWGKSANDLYNAAKQNTPYLFPYEFGSMEQVLAKEMEMPVEGLTQILPIGRSPQMYILSNNTGVNGATSILYGGVLKSIADRFGSDLIIIPSSINEVLILKADGEFSISDVTEMVKEVNAEEVAPEEVLSDHAYQYVRALDRITM